MSDWRYIPRSRSRSIYPPNLYIYLSIYLSVVLERGGERHPAIYIIQSYILSVKKQAGEKKNDRKEHTIRMKYDETILALDKTDLKIKMKRYKSTFYKDKRFNLSRRHALNVCTSNNRA